MGGVQKTKTSKLMHFFFFLIFFPILLPSYFIVSAKLGLSQYCMSFMLLALTLKKGSYKLHIWLVEMGSEPPWTQTFSESWLEDQGLKTNTHIEILFIFASFSSQSQRFPRGNFPAGNVEVAVPGWLVSPTTTRAVLSQAPCSLCAFPIPSSICQRLFRILNPLGWEPFLWNGQVHTIPLWTLVN